VDALCRLVGEVAATVEPGERMVTGMERAGETTGDGPVRDSLASLANFGSIDAELLHAALADHAASGWACPALHELFR